MEYLKVEKPTKNIAVVTINRESAMNAMTPAMITSLAEIFRTLRKDNEIRAVILTGAGTKAFSAGVDLTQAGNVFTDQKPDPENDPRIMIEAFPWPVIAAVNGFAITGGFEIVLACDIIIGSTNAKFSDTHAKFGIAPSWGLSQKLSRMIGISRAKEIHFTARVLGAQEAYEWGLLNRVVAPEALLPTCLEVAKQIVTMQPILLKRYKQTIDQGFAKTFGDGCANEIQQAYEYYKSMTPEQFKMMKEFIASRSQQARPATKSSL